MTPTEKTVLLARRTQKRGEDLHSYCKLKPSLGNKEQKGAVQMMWMPARLLITAPAGTELGEG